VSKPAISAIRVVDLPPGTLLDRYKQAGEFTDCRAIDVPQQVTLAEYIAAFYNSPAFRPERWLLGVLLNRGATAADVALLAAGTSQRFAAWTVEGRSADQLLLADYQGKTRSWLMVLPVAGGTRLLFGSAVVTSRSQTDRLVFRALLGFHAFYSRQLLRSAARALQRC
jgi:hypothetical protein